MQGKLPHQRARELHFATAPFSLTLDLYQDPGKSGSFWPQPHATHFAESDAFFAQLVVLNLICRNRNELFRTMPLAPFTCDFERRRLIDLTAALLGRHAVHWPLAHLQP